MKDDNVCAYVWACPTMELNIFAMLVMMSVMIAKDVMWLEDMRPRSHATKCCQVFIQMLQINWHTIFTGEKKSKLRNFAWRELSWVTLENWRMKCWVTMMIQGCTGREQLKACLGYVAIAHCISSCKIRWGVGTVQFLLISCTPDPACSKLVNRLFCKKQNTSLSVCFLCWLLRYTRTQGHNNLEKTRRKNQLL